jgi:hypothetical protein
MGVGASHWLELRRKLDMRKFALVVVMLLVSCAPQGIRPLRPYELATAPYHSGEGKSLVGSLMYEGGCLLFRSEDERKQVLPVWPTGSIFQESLVTFHRPGRADQQVAVGQEILMTGQDAEWSSLDNATYERFQRQCGAQPFFVTAIAPAN